MMSNFMLLLVVLVAFAFLASASEQVTKTHLNDQLIATKRIRKEIREMHYDEWIKITNAINIMKFTSQEEGTSKYGNKFWNWDDMSCFYAGLRNVHVNSALRGGKSSSSPHFMLWHRIIGIIFENSLISIDPTIESAPYWDFRNDIIDYNTFNSNNNNNNNNKDDNNNYIYEHNSINSIIWTDLYFGDLIDDDEDNSYTIENGPFQHWPTGADCVNSPNIGKDDRFATRMGELPMCNQTDAYYGVIPNSRSVRTWQECLNVAIYDSYTSFVSCYERIGLENRFNDGGCMIAAWNDPILLFYHINLDRYFYLWQLNNYNNSPYYNYAKKKLRMPILPLQTDNDIINGIFDQYPSNKTLTYQDIFDLTSFLKVSYTYDDILETMMDNMDEENGIYDDMNNDELDGKSTERETIKGPKLSVFMKRLFDINMSEKMASNLMIIVLFIVAYGTAFIRFSCMMRESNAMDKLRVKLDIKNRVF